MVAVEKDLVTGIVKSIICILEHMARLCLIEELKNVLRLGVVVSIIQKAIVLGKIIRTARDGNEIINKKNHAEIILYDRHGNEKEITFIDLEDVSKCRHERWSLTNHGYVICTIKHNGKSYLRLQNLIMNHKQSRKTVIDHKDGDKLNNRKSNLRIAKTWQNNVNRNFNIKNKVSKYRGVSPAKYEKKPWTASIKADGIRYFLGYYYTEIEAAQAYDVAAKKHHKEFAVLNEV